MTIATMDDKGQIIIPEPFIKEIGLTGKTKFIVMYDEGTVIMQEIQMSDIKKRWSSLFKKMSKKRLNVSGRIIVDEVKRHRRAKNRK